MEKRGEKDDRTGSLFRMLEDKLELERSFGVESIPAGKPEADAAEETQEKEALVDKPPVARPSSSTISEGQAAAISPLPPEGGEGQGEGGEEKEAVVGKPVVAQSSDGSKAERLAALEAEAADCQECPLGSTRTNLVFGAGNPDADILFIGEAPGADEDAQGIPFVGRAGKLLTKIINAMGLERSDVYIANILKCRPPENRNPRPTEVVSCLPCLRRQIEIIGPKVMVCLGGVAAKTLLQTNMAVGRMRGTFHDYEGTALLVTFHTAYLLRNPAEKAKVWEDMKMVLRKLGLPVPAR